MRAFNLKNLATICLTTILSGCTPYFTVYTNHPESGEPFVFYETYEFCGIVTNNEYDFGLFITENGGYPNQGDLNVWYYNFSDEQVRLNKFKYSFGPLTGARALTIFVEGNSIAKLGQYSFKFPNQFTSLAFTYSLSINTVQVTGEHKLSRFKYQARKRVKKGCGFPRNESNLRQILSEQEWYLQKKS